MKINDIPKFIQESEYEVVVPLGHIEGKIKEYIEDFSLELNPDFQRGHCWNEEQEIAYVEFFLKGGKTAKVLYFNCPYFTGIKSANDEMDMVCVDGLQRLTSLRKFLNNELKAFGCYLKEFEDAVVLKRLYNARFNVNNLKTRKEVLQWYLDFNEGGTVHTQKELDRVKELLLKETERTK